MELAFYEISRIIGEEPGYWRPIIDSQRQVVIYRWAYDPFSQIQRARGTRLPFVDLDCEHDQFVRCGMRIPDQHQIPERPILCRKIGQTRSLIKNPVYGSYEPSIGRVLDGSDLAFERPEVERLPFTLGQRWHWQEILLVEERIDDSYRIDQLTWIVRIGGVARILREADGIVKIIDFYTYDLNLDYDQSLFDMANNKT